MIVAELIEILKTHDQDLVVTTGRMGSTNVEKVRKLGPTPTRPCQSVVTLSEI